MTTADHALSVHYLTRRKVLASARSEDGRLSLFVPTREIVPVGTMVRLEVSFADSAQTYELQGTVIWKRAQALTPGAEAGLGVEFEESEKYRAAQMVAFCAGRPVDEGTALERRVAAQLSVTIRVGKDRLSGHVRDLSSTGAFVAGHDFSKLERGTVVTIQIRVGWLGLRTKDLQARVVWNGFKDGVFGFGARFVEDALRVRPLLRPYLAKASQAVRP